MLSNRFSLTFLLHVMCILVQFWQQGKALFGLHYGALDDAHGHGAQVQLQHEVDDLLPLLLGHMVQGQGAV